MSACIECGEDDTVVETADGRVLCIWCAHQCGNCGEWVSRRDDVYTMDRDYHVTCENCTENSLMWAETYHLFH